ncbi:unknown [Firmicutes bacterium CAG:631]|nr:unknown [Firmicutes bacterium CAG:631]
MELEYPKYDEQIYNVVDQTLDATKQEDVVLAEKEFKEKRKSIFHELRNKDIKKIWHRTLWIFILTIPLALFIRLLLTPIILKDQKFSPLSYWLLSPLGAILLLLFIALTIFEFFQFIFTVQYLKEKSNRITNQGIKYGLFSLFLLILYVVGALSFIIYMIYLLI